MADRMKVRELKALLATLDEDLEIRLVVKDHYSRYGEEADISRYDPSACIHLSHTVNSSFGWVTINAHLRKNNEGKNPKITFRK